MIHKIDFEVGEIPPHLVSEKKNIEEQLSKMFGVDVIVEGIDLNVEKGDSDE